MTLRFLRLDEVIHIHTDQIDRYGGSRGVRELALLESAVAAPPASFGGTYLHATVAEMAAAYLYHLAQNRPLVDGNKRAAAASAFLFLYVNDLLLDCTEAELVDLTLGIASGQRTKAEAAVFIAEHVTPFAPGRGG